jgi:hypothetical protein
MLNLILSKKYSFEIFFLKKMEKLFIFQNFRMIIKKIIEERIKIKLF